MFAKQCLAVWSTLWRRPGAWLVAVGLVMTPLAITTFSPDTPESHRPSDGTPYDWVRPETTSRFNTVRQGMELKTRDRQRPLSVSVSGLVSGLVSEPVREQPTAVDPDVQHLAWLKARNKVFKELSGFNDVVGASWKVPAPDADTLRQLAALSGLQGLKLDSYAPVSTSSIFGCWKAPQHSSGST